MCTAAFQGVLQKAGKLDLAGRLSQKMDASDPLAKSMGFSGIMNPAEELKAKVSGAPTETTKKSIRQGIATRDAAHQATRVTGAPGHVMAIAARKARAEF